MEGVSGPESGDIGLSSVERALGSVWHHSTRVVEWSGRRDRERQKSIRHLDPGRTSRNRGELRQSRATVRTAADEEDFSWRERCQTRRHSDRRCPRGYSMPSRMAVSFPRWKSNQRNGAAPEAAVHTARAVGPRA